MSKRYKNIKRVLILMMIILFSVEIFAAIVSDNDGTAFVTKAEFETLKQDFANQVNNYNNSIDKKIDGAISAYLAGINLQKAQSLTTILKDWDKVTMRNKELKNTYELPGAKVSLSYYGAGISGATWNQYPSAYGLAFVGKNSSSEAKLKSVLLKDGKEENYNDLTKNQFYWNGLITDYEEKIAMSKLGYNDGQDVAGAFRDIKLAIYDTVRLNTIDNSYYSSVSDFWDSKWKPLLKGEWYDNKDSLRNPDWNPTYAGGFFSWASQYNKDKIENKYELTWAAVDENVINPDFSKCFYTFSDNTKTSKNMIDAMSINKAGTWLKLASRAAMPDTSAGTRGMSSFADDAEGEGKGWTRTYIESHYQPTELSATIYDWTRGTTSGGEYPIPTLGGLGPISSNKIYLQKKDFSYTFKDRDYTKEVTTMNDGFPLIFARKDSELTWTCSFTAVEGSKLVKDNGEVKVILSYGQFNDESESKDGKYVQEDGTLGTEEFAWTTKNKTSKIKWIMQEDGWIYAKWFPAALTSSEAKAADEWYITLDGKNSNRISYIDKS